MQTTYSNNLTIDLQGIPQDHNKIWEQLKKLEFGQSWTFMIGNCDIFINVDDNYTEFDDIESMYNFFIRNINKEDVCIYGGTDDIYILLEYDRRKSEYFHITFRFRGSDLTNEKFIFYDNFFYTLFKDMMTEHFSYVSRIHFLKEGQFFRERGMLTPEYVIFDTSFNEVIQFWHCVTHPDVYKKYDTKESLLKAPFVKVEEWENGNIEMIQYEEPLALDSEKSLNQMKAVWKYLNKARKESSSSNKSPN